MQHAKSGESTLTSDKKIKANFGDNVVSVPDIMYCSCFHCKRRSICGEKTSVDSSGFVPTTPSIGGDAICAVTSITDIFIFGSC